ncbi:MAG TPA: hypothetical protein VJ801_07345 [Polyangia bacterium]|jgi:hypothetical protein|nr:hypothetical protein [Polyangia bacterium]
MARPIPYWNPSRAAWDLDLRTPWALGRHTLRLPAPPAGLIEAINAARDLLDALRAGATSSQLDLPGAAGRTLAATITDFLEEARFSSTGGERWKRETCALLRRELGNHPLSAFAPPPGTALLWSYRDERRLQVGPKAMESRLIVLQQILRWSTEPARAWLTFLPTFPSCKLRANPDEKIRVALSKWIDEATFRTVRARIFEHQTARNVLGFVLRQAGRPDDAAAVRDLVCRRRLYLSFAFYTGMRKHDLDEISDAYLSPEFDTYWRHGRKTGAEVAPESICPPFLADILAERRRLDRPWKTGELIAGGPWKNAPRVLAIAARNASVAPFNLMDCRRSFVYHKALAGVPMDKLVNLMGHSSSRMIQGVYLLLQPRLQRDTAGAAWPAALTAVPGTGAGRLIPFSLPSQCQNQSKEGS